MIQATGKKVIVRILDDSKVTKGGLVLPDSYDSGDAVGLVISVGAEISEVVPGDQVLFPRNLGYNFKVNNDELRFLNVDQIIGVMKRG